MSLIEEKTIEIKKCKHCSTQFEITDKDLEFYDKVSPVFNDQKYAIPTPTFCPDCRLQRRMSFRNDRVFYKRKSDLSGKEIISVYSPESNFKIYHQSEWWKDDWNPLDYGMEVDSSKSFFEQWYALSLKVPHQSLDLVNCENSDFCNYCGDDKDCYLDIAGEANENCYFDLFTKYSNYCVDNTFVYHSELLYECISCYKSYKSKYCVYLEDCDNCYFSFDLKGCKDCLFSSNLRNKQYCIKNKQYTKSEYQQKISELELSNHSKLQEAILEWKKQMSQAIHRNMNIINSQNSTGDLINDSKNTHFAYNSFTCEESKFLYDVLDADNCYDLNYSLYDPEVSYELISTLNMKFSAFSTASHYSRNIFYCDSCNHSDNLFGCIGLKNKSYCILNKQYTKEQYEELVPKIIKTMVELGEWGEFFPSTLSPFGYNQTVACEYFPLSKQEAGDTGFNWSDYEAPFAKVDKIIPANKIPDNITDIPDDILEWAIECEMTKKPFRIIPQELEFYRKHNLPIPRRHPDQRHLDRMKIRNPRKLFKRDCDKCGTGMQTTYSPDRKETVYCEECYNKEVY